MRCRPIGTRNATIALNSVTSSASVRATSTPKGGSGPFRAAAHRAGAECRSGSLRATSSRFVEVKAGAGDCPDLPPPRDIAGLEGRDHRRGFGCVLFGHQPLELALARWAFTPKNPSLSNGTDLPVVNWSDSWSLIASPNPHFSGERPSRSIARKWPSPSAVAYPQKGEGLRRRDPARRMPTTVAAPK